MMRFLVPYTVAAAWIVVSIVASGHAILYKRDPRAAVAWTGVIWLVPFLGALLYGFFGINRIQRRAAHLRRRRRPKERPTAARLAAEASLGAGLEHLAPLTRVGEHVVGRPLLEGNRIAPLVNGEEAFPEMIRAIEGAAKTVALEAYIFAKDSVGDEFIAALSRAAARGVDVRVLIDDVGSSGSVRAVERALRSGGVRVDRFLPVGIRWRTWFANLRNHRKILVVDGRIGFTGGMNIRETHLVSRKGPGREQDVHFRLEGPVVEQLQDVFVDDWSFVTEETLPEDPWSPRVEPVGTIKARGVPYDPGEAKDSLRWILVAALSCARRSVRIVTPYFLPDPALIASLNVAALRGVRVDILLPRAGDHAVVQWASTAMLWQVLAAGCRVWYTPPPFDHSKIVLVDGGWSFVGSANIDPRSLRLNFEFNVECYDTGFAALLERLVEGRLAGAREVTLREVDSRGLWVRLRDGLARLFAPYL